MSIAKTNPRLMEACSGLGEQSNTGYRANIFVIAEDLMEAVSILDRAGYFIEDISCLDMQEGFQAVYHFDRFEIPFRVCLRVSISRETPELPSISSIFPGADWHERECSDFFGIRFTGHPNLIPLLLDPEHDGPPPLVKEESLRKDMHQLYPGWTGTPIKPGSDEFSEAINHLSNHAK